MAQLDPQYDFLSQVKFNDVKKCWKKALSNNNNKKQGGGEDGKKEASVASAKAALAGVEEPSSKDTETKEDGQDVLKMYTVGNGWTIQTLAENYTREAAAKAAAEVAAASKEDAAAQEEENGQYVHCFLDVPADRSGKKPYQALINFNGSEPTSGGSSSKKSKKKMNDREVVKIQVAAALPGMGKFPMLLYNQSRSARTFIHPEEEQNSDYDKIHDWIVNGGTKGVLQGGGTKAYFFAKITRRQGGEQDIVSIDISQLAPPQNW